MDLNSIKNFNLFSGLDAGELTGIFADLQYRLKTFKKNELIVLQGDLCKELLIVTKGTVIAEMLDISGKVLKIEDIESPHTLAEAFLFGENNRFPVQVIAKTNAELLYIPKAELINMLQANAVVLTNFLDAVSQRTQFLSRRISSLSFKTIRGRLAAFLLEQARDGDTVLLQRSQKDLAEYFGVERPSLSRVLGEMADKDLIEIDGKKIKLKDKHRLRNELM